MKKQLSFSVILAMALSLQAQEANPVVIVNATGKVALIPQNETTAMGIASGAVAKNTGQLNLAKGAKAVVYCNGQFINVKGNQTVALSSICGNAPARRGLNFDRNFGDLLLGSIEMIAAAKSRGDGWANAVPDPKKSGDGWGTAVPDPKKSGDGWGTAVPDPKKSGDGWGTAVPDPKKSGDGWGGNGNTIASIMPFGKIKATGFTFRWSKPAGNQAYRVVITDINNKTIHSVEVRDTFAQIDLRKLNLSVGGKYRWKVSTNGNEPITSTELEFGIGTELERKAALSNAMSSGLFKSSNAAVLRGLTEAIALENDQWFYDAHQIYIKLQKHHDNMANYMHSAFWMRYGFGVLAKKAVSG